MFIGKSQTLLFLLSWLTVNKSTSVIYSSSEVTTQSFPTQFSDDISSIGRANILLSKLNTQISEHLKQATNLGESFTTVSLLYGAINSEDNYEIGSAKFPFSASSKDKKFEAVLHNLDILQDQVEEAITNFTTSKRFSYSAMLKPMLRNINQLRDNLTLLRTRLIGVTALSSISEQVNELTDQIGEALAYDQPPSVSESIEEPPKERHESLPKVKPTQLQ